MKSLLNQKLSSLKAKASMFQFFQMLLGYEYLQLGKKCKKNMNLTGNISGGTSFQHSYR